MDKDKIHYRFGMDYSQLPPLPEDPLDRLPYFQSLKNLITSEKDKIRAWHQNGAGGREVIQVHTRLMDDIIMYLVDSLVALDKYANASPLKELTVIAVGGYGRGELNPCSDIDLLFLRPKNIKRSTDNFIQDLTSVLWGIGLDIGQSVRTVQDCLALAKQDLTIKTSMIETRFLTGNKENYEKFSKSIQKNILGKNVRAFLNSKVKEKYDRHGSGDAVVSDPEPDIKDGPGGLRDYHTALWATAVRFGCLSFREIGPNDAIADEELDMLYESVNFTLRVRNELHYLVGRKTDIMTREIQKDLARNLGYRSFNPAEAVEKFMRDYFLHATNIYRYSETIFQLCYQKKSAIKKVFSTFTQKSLTDNYYADQSMLFFKGDADELFHENKHLILEAFTLCQEHGLTLDYTLKRQIRRHKNLFDDAFIQDTVLHDFLFTLLNKPKSENTLRLMHDTGILGCILPEFGNMHCMVSYDFYHRYTADEHSLRMVGFLEELLTPAGKKKVEKIAELYANCTSKDLLKLTALLQALGKTHQSDCTARQALLEKVSQRLKLDTEAQETMIFLIENLNEMTETALHQDIYQPEVLQSFAKKVATCQRLDLLYIMTYVQLRAVAPGTWTSWKKVALSELYNRTQLYIDNPESLHEQPRTTKLEVYRQLRWECPASEIESHLQQMPDDYLLSTRSEEVVLHIRLIRSLQDKLFIMNHQYNEEGGFHLLTFCCQDKLDIFDKLLGTLTSKNINILGARIYSKRDGIVIIAIEIERSDRLDGDNLKIWKDVKEVLTEVLEGRKNLKNLLASRIPYNSKDRSNNAIIPKIKIENPPDGQFTLIRVEARDHLGMLYKIAKTFANASIQIHRAKIATQGDRGIDVFYVSLRNEKLVYPKLIRNTKERLVHALLMEKLEDIPN
jgi:[protein-PII] uridylyltransferase